MTQYGARKGTGAQYRTEKYRVLTVQSIGTGNGDREALGIPWTINGRSCCKNRIAEFGTFKLEISMCMVWVILACINVIYMVNSSIFVYVWKLHISIFVLTVLTIGQDVYPLNMTRAVRRRITHCSKQHIWFCILICICIWQSHCPKHLLGTRI